VIRRCGGAHTNGEGGGGGDSEAHQHCFNRSPLRNCTPLCCWYGGLAAECTGGAGGDTYIVQLRLTNQQSHVEVMVMGYISVRAALMGKRADSPVGSGIPLDPT